MKIFKWVKTIVSKDGKLHFKRFAILETERFAIYIHRIYESDKDEHLHSHPWHFWGMVLKGSYVERYKKYSTKDAWIETRTLKPFMQLRGDFEVLPQDRPHCKRSSYHLVHCGDQIPHVVL